MGWISKLFSKTDEPEMPSPSTGFHDLEGHPVPISLATTDARVARALVHNAATLTAQVYALPANWLSFEVVTISDDEKAYFQLQVLMNHWDEYLVAHSYAFERAVIKKVSIPMFSDRVQMEEMFVDFNPFLFHNEPEGALVRLSSSSLMNITSGGGQTALLVLENM